MVSDMTDQQEPPEEVLPGNCEIKAPFVSVSSRFGNRVKRLADLLIAATLIVLALPLMGFIALAIKCDSSGPVFDRDGPFVALRFRTTVHVGARDTRPVRTTESERQLTRLGWFLRDTRLDRLAQRYIAEGYSIVVDLDLEKFFDRVNHDGLMARVGQEILADHRIDEADVERCDVLRARQRDLGRRREYLIRRLLRRGGGSSQQQG
jgi:Bacterial sugar transferase